MEKKHIKAEITNDLNEASVIDTIGEYDENENVISYYDKNVFVHVIINDKIVIKREHPDYNLELIFEKNKKHRSLYKIYSPQMELEVEVDTLNLKREANSFYIEYRLTLNNENMGLFSINFKWEE
jgi:uncharacterized beta-barrel protein YwiB (DUF1934 family)